MDKEDPAFREALGDDLVALLREHAPPVVSVSRVNALSSASWNRGSFRIGLADGSFCKGRRFESQKGADRVAFLSQFLPEGAFPRVIGRLGVAELSEWIEGTVLALCPITEEVLRGAGALAGTIHAVEIPEPLPEALRYRPEEARALLARKAQSLETAGTLTPDERKQTLDLADAHAPTTAAVGLVHNDLCPENIVIDINGSLRVVDNDSIKVQPIALDLARTWYRWPMTVAERQTFESRYGRDDSLDSYREHFAYWAVVVLVGAAEFRLRHQLPGLEAPVQRLREILLE